MVSMRLAERLTIVLVAAVGINGCTDDNSADPTIEFDSMEGTYVLVSATFREPTDVDGDGPRTATTDAKTILYDIWDVYAECPSSDEPIFRFTTGAAQDVDLICPTTGLARDFGGFQWFAFQLIFDIHFDEWNDPGGLYVWQDFSRFFILQTSQTETGWRLIGETELRLAITPDVFTLIDFEMHQVNPD